MRTPGTLLLVCLLVGCGTVEQPVDTAVESLSAAPSSGPPTAPPTAPSSASPGSPEATAATAAEGSAVSGINWDNWEPIFTDARPATEADVADLERRVAALNASSWTMFFPEPYEELEFELAVTAHHVRMDLGLGAEIHLDPAHLRESYIFCADGDGCLQYEVAPESEEGDFLGPLVTFLSDAVAAQRDPGLRLGGSAAYAVVESPAGPLDCVVHLGDHVPADLEGAYAGTGGGRDLSLPSQERVCVDERGLVVLSRTLTAPLIPFSRWRPGVPDGIDEHPPASTEPY